MKKTIMVVLLCSSVCFGQQGGGGQQAPPQNPPQGGGQPGGGRQPSGQPNIPDRTAPQQPTAEIPRQIYLSGSVRLSDGTIPPASVVIERVCGGVLRPEAYTDSQGNFNLIVGGQKAAVISGASVGGGPAGGAPPP